MPLNMSVAARSSWKSVMDDNGRCLGGDLNLERIRSYTAEAPGATRTWRDLSSGEAMMIPFVLCLGAVLTLGLVGSVWFVISYLLQL
jgi:hypothetical protein